jgi:hypothetical protein
MYTNELQRLVLSSNGSTMFSPDGSTPVFSVESGRILASGRTDFVSGIFVSTGSVFTGDCTFGGSVVISSVNTSANIMLGSTEASTSITNGAVRLRGGLAIGCTLGSTGVSAGGGLTVAGGASIVQRLNVGGQTTVWSTEQSTSSLSGAFVVYGGTGINGTVHAKTDSVPQIKIAPVTPNGPCAIGFHASNTFATTGAFTLGTRSSGALGIGAVGAVTDNLVAFSNGSVGIPCTTNAAGLGTGGSLTVAGGMTVLRDVYVGGTVQTSSDERLKENIKLLGNGVLDQLCTVRTATFNYTDKTQNSESQLGFMAQDFIDWCPELVRGNTLPSGFLSLEYSKVTVLLVQALREMKLRIEALENK